eukprot:g5059.t1
MEECKDWPKLEQVGDITHRRLHADMILHQANCVMNQGGAQGLAKTLLDKYPYADIYNGKYKERQPGTAILSHPPRGWRGPTIAHLLGQKRFGHPSEKENEKTGREWFGDSLKCLFKQLKELLEKHPNQKEYTIAIPMYIGCGLAGGRWGDYSQYLDQFVEQARKHIKCPLKFVFVSLYQKGQQVRGG